MGNHKTGYTLYDSDLSAMHKAPPGAWYVPEEGTRIKKEEAWKREKKKRGVVL